MRKVEAQIAIGAPVQQVWGVLADFGGICRWAPSTTNSYSTSENNSGPEASRHRDMPGRGIDEYITEWNEGRDFTYFSAGVGLISNPSTTWSVKPQGNKTLVHTELRYGLRMGPYGALMNALIIRQKFEQALEKALAAGVRVF